MVSPGATNTWWSTRLAKPVRACVCVCIGAVFGATQAYTHCGWQGYAHWLGTTSASSVRDTKKNSTPPLPFHEAVAVVHALGLQNRQEWRAWCQSEARASNMPLWPNSAYKKSGWRGWGHWLGTSFTRNVFAVAEYGAYSHVPFPAALSLLNGCVRAWCNRGASRITPNEHTCFQHTH